MSRKDWVEPEEHILVHYAIHRMTTEPWIFAIVVHIHTRLWYTFYHTGIGDLDWTLDNGLS